MKDNNTLSGIKFIDLLAILFIALKLCKVINWSWLWVLSPIWGGLALIVVLLILGLIANIRN